MAVLRSELVIKRLIIESQRQETRQNRQDVAAPIHAVALLNDCKYGHDRYTLPTSLKVSKVEEVHLMEEPVKPLTVRNGNVRLTRIFHTLSSRNAG